MCGEARDQHTQPLTASTYWLAWAQAKVEGLGRLKQRLVGLGSARRSAGSRQQQRHQRQAAGSTQQAIQIGNLDFGAQVVSRSLRQGCTQTCNRRGIPNTCKAYLSSWSGQSIRVGYILKSPRQGAQALPRNLGPGWSRRATLGQRFIECTWPRLPLRCLAHITRWIW